MYKFVKYNQREWAAYAEKAHSLTFSGETLGGDRIDFALLCVDPDTDKPVAYATCLESGDTLRVKFGGVLGLENRGHGLGKVGYASGIHWLRGRYRHIKAAVANTNLPSIRMHLSLEFKIIGVQIFGDEVLLEFHRDLEKT